MASTIFIDNKVLHLLLKGKISNEQENAVELPLRTQPDGTLRGWSILIGVDPDDRERPALTDSNRMLRMRPYEPFEEIIVTEIGAAWTVCAENATADSIMVVDVEIWKYATDATTSGVDIRFDDGILQWQVVEDLQVMAQAPPVILGPYHLGDGWSIDMKTNLANKCRAVATIKHFGMDAL